MRNQNRRTCARFIFIRDKINTVNPKLVTAQLTIIISVTTRALISPAKRAWRKHKHKLNVELQAQGSKNFLFLMLVHICLRSLAMSRSGTSLKHEESFCDLLFSNLKKPVHNDKRLYLIKAINAYWTKKNNCLIIKSVPDDIIWCLKIKFIA